MPCEKDRQAVDLFLSEAGKGIYGLVLALDQILIAGFPAIRTVIARWLANKSTKDLIAADENLRVEMSQGGDNKGTYASEDLAIAYGMWISAEFYDQVIEAFKALVRGEIQASNS